MTAESQDRSKRLLTALIREYISSGEPVASSVLVTAAGLGISSATVRSILARLEVEGFVQQPHTSAGRIPTDRGYRFYVDLLLDSKRSSRLSSTAWSSFRWAARAFSSSSWRVAVTSSRRLSRSPKISTPTICAT